jgi:hypothetical protein
MDTVEKLLDLPASSNFPTIQHFGGIAFRKGETNQSVARMLVPEFFNTIDPKRSAVAAAMPAHAPKPISPITRIWS